MKRRQFLYSIQDRLIANISYSSDGKSQFYLLSTYEYYVFIVGRYIIQVYLYGGVKIYDDKRVM